MPIWIRALLSTAVEIKTLEGRELLVGRISPPVTDLLLHNTSIQCAHHFDHLGFLPKIATNHTVNLAKSNTDT